MKVSTKSMKDLYVFTSVRFLLLSSSLNFGIRQSPNSSCVQSRIGDRQKAFSNSRIYDFRTSNILKQINPLVISCNASVHKIFLHTIWKNCILWWRHRWRKHFCETKVNQAIDIFQISAFKHYGFNIFTIGTSWKKMKICVTSSWLFV